MTATKPPAYVAALEAALAANTWESGIVYGLVECDQCGKDHEAEFSHWGRFGEGPIFAVICTEDGQGLTDYYTSLRVRTS